MSNRRSPTAALVILLGVMACSLSSGGGGGDRVPLTNTPGAESTREPATEEPENRPPDHRIAVRVVDGVGEFYDTQTGERFVPRGMNYNRFLISEDGNRNDNLLSTTRYDPETVDADLAAMRAMGFNVVRVMMETCGVHINGCVAGADGRLNLAYFDNLADFLRRAQAHDMVVMVASNTLPDDGYWINATAARQNAFFQGASNEFLNPESVPIYVDYWESVVRALIESEAPLDVIWAYELRQEQHVHLTEAPLNLEEGLITTANGQSYDLSDAEAKMQMIDEGVTYWAGTLRAAIRALDPTALVTVGFFTPNAPHPVNGADTRLVRTAYFMRNSSMDFFDLHHYPGNGVDDNQVWENFGIEGVNEKPLVLGEYGAYADWFASEDRAAAAVMGMEVGSCQVGFDGWLVWSWRGDSADDIWWASEGDGLIARVVSPLERPDPCAYKTFDFIRFNVAPQAAVTASSAVAGQEPEHVADETGNIWNAAALAPQWIQLDLAAPTDVVSIRLVVAQDPPGRSVHELWIQQAGGGLTLAQTYDGVTESGDVLVFEPAEPLPGVEVVRVVTTYLIDLWPAWQEIEVLSATLP